MNICVIPIWCPTWMPLHTADHDSSISVNAGISSAMTQRCKWGSTAKCCRVFQDCGNCQRVPLFESSSEFGEFYDPQVGLGRPSMNLMWCILVSLWNCATEVASIHEKCKSHHTFVTSLGLPYFQDLFALSAKPVQSCMIIKGSTGWFFYFPLSQYSLQ